MPRKCLVCASDAGLQCKQCQGAVYCSKICQRIDWNADHHLACKSIAPNLDSPKKKQMQTEPVLASLRFTLLQVADSLQDLLTNPPQKRSDDFMHLLQNVQSSLQKALQAVSPHVSGTLVPETAYIDLLESAAEAARALAAHVNNSDDFSIDDLNDLVDAVDAVVRRVRAILLNPDVWLPRNQPDTPASTLPENDLAAIAERQKPLEFTRPGGWTVELITNSFENDEEAPIVSDGTIYRILRDNFIIIANGTKSHVKHPSWRLGEYSRPSFFAGLHGTVWQWGEGTAANFRYKDIWQMIQSVKIPEQMIPIGVDAKNRLWLHLPVSHLHDAEKTEQHRIAMVRTDEIGRTPTVVSWGVKSRLISATVTAIGLVVLFSGKERLVNFMVDDDNKYTAQPLEASIDALKLATIDKESISAVCLVGHCASSQITVLYRTTASQLLRIHNLVTRVTHTHTILLGDAFSGATLLNAAIGNDGRSIYVAYNGVQTLPDVESWKPRVFRLYS